MGASFGEIGERLRRLTVQIQGSGSGSGVVWSDDGLVVTNAHVIQDRTPQVSLWDGRAFPGHVVRRDARRDLALLRIGARGLAAEVADSRALRPGELVVAVGNPLGFVGALSTGVVHAVTPRWVQADVRLAPGNSGGPLANARGEVVGINTMIAGGLALSIPSHAVQRYLAGEDAEARLGVTVRPVPATQEGRRVLGLLVLDVEEGSAADRASLLVGDILIGAQQREFSSLDDFSEAIASARGQVLTLRFLRGGKTVSREVAAQLAVRSAA